MIRWGLIGCGDVTEVKSGPAYQQVPGFELHTVSARTPGKAQDFATRHHVPCYYTDSSKLIHDPNVDAVYIASPPDSHLELALEVANAGKICCIEKPMAVNHQQCEQILDAFSTNNLPLFVAYYRRSLPGFVQIKNWITEGVIGEVRHIDWRYSRPPSQIDLDGRPNWRTDKHVAPGGYFDDLASHGIDIMTFLLGNVRKAQGFATNQQALYSASDAIVASLLFECGATGSGSWNFASECYQDQMEILGSKGSIRFGIFSDMPASLLAQDGCASAQMPKPTPIQLPFVQAIADHLAGIHAHPSLGQSAAHTSWVMDAILTTNQVK
ncbi:Gfo/Idh/MocA family oxidoreductase [Aliiglaciecola sp. LCG003]|uniref:Gfo/Idh/MocA family protein n=1 Tax=Aliiglaciecola sp. LCG003 TaxID=3053655 RepID=UPI00257320A5|nr:Gfo/Idh/MocA family oxidoreductase [Aliiglaciecola sp. LCG003]WJG09284.1 Gfo/Idh/MocA family oxidoreductase [Aliiglaciecola sp. LCG003]